MKVVMKSWTIAPSLPNTTALHESKLNFAAPYSLLHSSNFTSSAQQKMSKEAHVRKPWPDSAMTDSFFWPCSVPVLKKYIMSYYWFLTSLSLMNANLTTMLSNLCAQIFELFKISIWKQKVRPWNKTFKRTLLRGRSRETEAVPAWLGVHSMENWSQNCYKWLQLIQDLVLENYEKRE